MKIRVNKIDFSGSFVDGPGVRSLLFLQGCEKRCDGCHNPSTWDLNGGELYENLELAAIIKKNCHNKKLTITGGEPLLQNDALIQLVKLLDGFDICLYTGYSKKEVSEELLRHIKYLKTGIYEKKYRTTTSPFVGSTNQSFIIL
jgi:anaerobic ribonucleoside-triphosphate reductase activating protein